MAAHQVGALDHLLATLSSESDDCDEEGREENEFLKPKVLLRDRLESLRCKVLSNIPFISWRSKSLLPLKSLLNCLPLHDLGALSPVSSFWNRDCKRTMLWRVPSVTPWCAYYSSPEKLQLHWKAGPVRDGVGGHYSMRRVIRVPDVQAPGPGIPHILTLAKPASSTDWDFDGRFRSFPAFVPTSATFIAASDCNDRYSASIVCGGKNVKVDDILHGYSNQLSHDIASSVCLASNGHIVAFSDLRGFSVCPYVPNAWYRIRIDFDFENHRYRVCVTPISTKKQLSIKGDNRRTTADNGEGTAKQVPEVIANAPGKGGREETTSSLSKWVNFWDPKLNFISHIYLFQHSRGGTSYYGPIHFEGRRMDAT